MFSTLRLYSKITEETTYSWEMYQQIIDLIISKILRDVTINLKNRNPKDGESSIDGGSEGKAKKSSPKKDKEFTIDEEFFHSAIMPTIYATIVASLKQENSSLFHLLYALEIAHKK